MHIPAATKHGKRTPTSLPLNQHSMMRKLRQHLQGWPICVVLLSLGLLFVGCSGDDNATIDETTTFTLRIENVAQAFDFPASGIFDTPVGATAPEGIGPGQAYEVIFSAAPGSRLSFATMLVQSNDFFFAPGGAGIDLFDTEGTPTTGDVTTQAPLWDAGTEADQDIGVGPNQPPRQAGPNTGDPDPDNTVRLVTNANANIPPDNEIIQVTLTPDLAVVNQFTLRIENVSATNALGLDPPQDLILSPGVFVIHTADAPLFTNGAPDRGEGLEALAEDGDPGSLDTALAAQTGLTVILSPGVVAVHTSTAPLFTNGAPDRGEGLETLAEDGNPTPLDTALVSQDGIVSNAVFDTPVGATDPGVIGPGGAYEVTFSADPGDRLSFATMFIPSNDFFFAPNGAGIALFAADGTPTAGDVTAQAPLWDAGTEVNQELGVSPDQPPLQTVANTGDPDADNTVRLIDATTENPPPDGTFIRVTLTPNP